MQDCCRTFDAAPTTVITFFSSCHDTRLAGPVTCYMFKATLKKRICMVKVPTLYFLSWRASTPMLLLPFQGRASTCRTE